MEEEIGLNYTAVKALDQSREGGGGMMMTTNNNNTTNREMTATTTPARTTDNHETWVMDMVGAGSTTAGHMTKTSLMAYMSWERKEGQGGEGFSVKMTISHSQWI